MKKIFSCLFLLLIVLNISFDVSANDIRKDIKINEKTLLNILVKSRITERNHLSLRQNNNDIVIINSFDSDLTVKRIDKGFALYNDKEKRRLEYTYDVKNSSKTVKLFGEMKDEFEDKYNEYEVTINIVSSDADKLYTYAKRWGVKDNEKPKELIKNIAVKYNKGIVDIPFISYVDLANINAFSIHSTTAGIEFYIGGGKDKDAYDALFLFNKYFLIKREVKSGEFPNNNRMQLSLYPFYKY